MDQEITNSVNGDTEAYEKQIVDAALNSVIKKNDAGNGKNDKKNVVAFKHVFVFRLMMVFMKIPHESVHDVFMSEPGDTFHQ
ncbi:hypothetical protein FFL01_25990 [Flavobacterium flevense]|uniref:Uncharacterized protein n=1 Tax=Flavobacterium flevense TaxID=983 RepID=A0A4Y4B1D4_9FLAO|nr:hypothetical protein FFL01_25990 [Flavobacterium flevense]